MKFLWIRFKKNKRKKALRDKVYKPGKLWNSDDTWEITLLGKSGAVFILPLENLYYLRRLKNRMQWLLYHGLIKKKKCDPV